MVCGEEKEKKVMFNKIVVENVEVGNGNKESTYRNRKTSIRTVLAGKCQVIDVGKFPATKSKVVYGVLLPRICKMICGGYMGCCFSGIKIIF